jgi:hypothetical protein
LAVPDFAPPTGVLLGAFASPGPAQNSEEALTELEAKVGRRFDLHRVFRLWDDVLPSRTLTQDVQKGRIPVVSWLPTTWDGAKLSWAQIAAGWHDDRIRQIANYLRCLPGPVIACLHHEPELATGYGTAPEYAAAVRHWCEVFRSRAADNVAHAFIGSPAAYRNSGLLAAELWAGDEYLDWVGVDAYNWFGCAAGQERHWVPLGNYCRSAVAWAKVHGKALLVAEWGSVEDPAMPGRKAAWIAEALDWARLTPTVRGLSYLHSAGSCPWWLDSSEESMAAFRQISADPYTNVR